MKHFKELLIDGDLLVFATCCALEYNSEVPVEFHKIAGVIESRVINMKKRLNADNVKLFFSSKNNFRYTVLPEYKAGRKGREPPENLAAAKSHCMVMFDSYMEEGLEADDLLAMYQEQDDSTVIATIDKDLLQVRGWHYRWETQHQGEYLHKVEGVGDLELVINGKKKKVVGEGIAFFCYQLLIGDPTDSIMGCGKLEDKVYKTGAKAGQAYQARKGVGAIKAFEALQDCTTYGQYMSVVVAYYKHHFDEDWKEQLLINGRLLYMVNTVDAVGRCRLWDFEKQETWYDPTTREITTTLKG